ncbi:glycosyltransferase [bacterium]|nr:glycosyltransferase [bacterium]
MIVVNDGSKDNTRSFLEKFEDRIILLNHYKNR